MITSLALDEANQTDCVYNWVCDEGHRVIIG